MNLNSSVTFSGEDRTRSQVPDIQSDLRTGEMTLGTGFEGTRACHPEQSSRRERGGPMAHRPRTTPKAESFFTLHGLLLKYHKALWSVRWEQGPVPGPEEESKMIRSP